MPVSLDDHNSRCSFTSNYSSSKRNVGQFRRLQSFSSSSATKIVAFNLSDIGEGIREVVIKEWFVNVGDKVQQFDNICEVQSDKASVTITSRYDGLITRLYYDVNQTALVGLPLVDIKVEAENAASEGSMPHSDEDTSKKGEFDVETSSGHRVKVLTTPSVRRIASQFKIDLSKVTATGKNGRIMKEDVLSYLNISADKSNELNSSDLESPSVPTVTTAKVPIQDKRIPITGFTKAMMKSMTEAMKIPHFGLSDEYNVTNLVMARQNLKSSARERGVKLTYMPIIIKAASLSLAAHPILNSSISGCGEFIVYKGSHNIGVAMDTPNGLTVPVIKDVQNKNIIEIAQELNTFQEKGARGQLGMNDLSGGSFTLSNIGIIGGTYTKPVIFPPQVSIGAFGKIQVLPRFDADGNVAKAHILTVSWSADHRVIDGVTMAKFSNSLKNYLENPYSLLLDI